MGPKPQKIDSINLNNLGPDGVNYEKGPLGQFYEQGPDGKLHRVSQDIQRQLLDLAEAQKQNAEKQKEQGDGVPRKPSIDPYQKRPAPVSRLEFLFLFDSFNRSFFLNFPSSFSFKNFIYELLRIKQPRKVISLEIPYEFRIPINKILESRLNFFQCSN